ncbi:MAG TPA: TraR/DksA C4-type zinc finger protein [Candidatus Cloacimonadota bacterium]|nr:TraR/DksA C4-type zinc finger protein [Candidatus Cloacimonadota bacterium]HOV17135.1 TraR/DksA C4-type zinc finger protein [Candidatus Cloacimonadota bacterium]HQL15411.1 TraR/DksA C4-type zinc finger protein [Candidatus Cloacimonadota bacterium]
MAGKSLSAAKLKHYEALIRKELEESMNYIKKTNQAQSIGAKESSGDLSSYAFHQADQGSDTNLMEQTVMLLEQEREKIRLLNEALRRIEDGIYGICEICGEPIPESRLEVIPYARYCIECKAKEEDKKRRRK